MSNVLYIVFAVDDDAVIVGNQKKLINKSKHIKFNNYESTIRIGRGTDLWVPEWDGKNLEALRRAISKRKAFEEDLGQLREDIAKMYESGGIHKLVTRAHGSRTAYAGMSPLCLAELLREAGLNACAKISLTGCQLGIAPNVEPEHIASRTARQVGLGSFAQKFQLSIFNVHPNNEQRNYVVHARTSNTTVNDDGTKSVKLLNDEFRNKALRGKIEFTIDANGNQSMKYSLDIDRSNKLCPTCRTENAAANTTCSKCTGALL